MASAAEGHPKLWGVTPNTCSPIPVVLGRNRAWLQVGGEGGGDCTGLLAWGLSQEDAWARGKPASSGRREATESREETETLPAPCPCL